MNKTDTAKIVAMITPAYRRDLDDEVKVEGLIGLWHELFKGESSAAIWRAVEAHMIDPERGRFLPRPADISAHLRTQLSAARPECLAVQKLIDWHRKHKSRCEAVGIPLASEHLAQRGTYAKWDAAYAARLEAKET